jgi:hypothetical protein
MEPDADDVIFETIRTMVSDGEYLDHIPALPGGPPPGPRSFFQRQADGTIRPMYLRGSREYLQARQAGLLVLVQPFVSSLPVAAAGDVHCW